MKFFRLAHEQADSAKHLSGQATCSGLHDFQSREVPHVFDRMTEASESVDPRIALRQPNFPNNRTTTMKQESGVHDRRSFHRYVIGGMGVAMSDSFVTSASAAESLEHPQSCRNAVDRLLEGNERFVNGKLRHPHISQQWRERLTETQKPFATILGCSDSRVPPEMLFDQGFGDLFVIRVAGNVVDTDVTGSIEYGVDHLQTKVVVVMGHQGCGAVTAAIQPEEQREREPNEIQSLVARIDPSLRNVPTEGKIEDRLAAAVEANVRWSVKQLSLVPDLAKAVKENRTAIIGCVYDLDTGRVRTL